MNIVLPPTSGAASCPAPMPVENVQDTPRRPTFCALSFVEAAEPRRRAVLPRHHPWPIVLLKRGRVGRDRADTARAESGREVSRVCPWHARSATPEIPASARSLASRVSSLSAESKRVSGAASVDGFRTKSLPVRKSFGARWFRIRALRPPCLFPSSLRIILADLAAIAKRIRAQRMSKGRRTVGGHVSRSRGRQAVGARPAASRMRLAISWSAQAVSPLTPRPDLSLVQGESAPEGDCPTTDLADARRDVVCCAQAERVPGLPFAASPFCAGAAFSSFSRYADVGDIGAAG